MPGSFNANLKLKNLCVSSRNAWRQPRHFLYTDLIALCEAKSSCHRCKYTWRSDHRGRRLMRQEQPCEPASTGETIEQRLSDTFAFCYLGLRSNMSSFAFCRAARLIPVFENLPVPPRVLNLLSTIFSLTLKYSSAISRMISPESPFEQT